MPLGTDTIKARKETFALCEVILEQNSKADIQNPLLMSADCFAIYASPPNPHLTESNTSPSSSAESTKWG